MKNFDMKSNSAQKWTTKYPKVHKERSTDIFFDVTTMGSLLNCRLVVWRLLGRSCVLYRKINGIYLAYTVKIGNSTQH